MHNVHIKNAETLTITVSTDKPKRPIKYDMSLLEGWQFALTLTGKLTTLSNLHTALSTLKKPKPAGDH